MTKTEACEWLRLKRDEVERMKNEIDLLAGLGRNLDALDRLREFVCLVDPDVALSIAMIADGQEAPS